MPRLLMVGSSDHGRAVALAVLAAGICTVAGFWDDGRGFGKPPALVRIINGAQQS